MKKNAKKLVGMLLTVLMILTIIPGTAFARSESSIGIYISAPNSAYGLVGEWMEIQFAGTGPSDSMAVLRPGSCLPPGLGFVGSRVNGAIYGTPTQAGVFYMPILFGRYGLGYVSHTIRITIESELAITYQVPEYIRSWDYILIAPTIINYGNLGNRTFELIFGDLPFGMYFDPDTGKFYGRAMSIGEFPFAVKVHDSQMGAAISMFVLTVKPANLILNAPKTFHGVVGEPFHISISGSGPSDGMAELRVNPCTLQPWMGFFGSRVNGGLYGFPTEPGVFEVMVLFGRHNLGYVYQTITITISD